MGGDDIVAQIAIGVAATRFVVGRRRRGGVHQQINPAVDIWRRRRQIRDHHRQTRLLLHRRPAVMRDHLMALFGQPRRQSTTDETAGPGDHDSHPRPSPA